MSDPALIHPAEALLAWHQSNQPLLDLRDVHEYLQYHVVGSTNIPWKSLDHHVSELPPKRRPVPIVCDNVETLQLAKAFLMERDYLVPFVFLWGPDLIEAANALQLLVNNSSASKILWEPSPCLLGMIERIEKIRSDQGLSPVGLAADVACGGGRDVVFLALRGWNAIAVDYQQQQCDKVLQLAIQYQVDDKVVAKCIDVEKHSDELLRQVGTVDLVNVARYLNRDLMPQLRSMINIGGFIVFHQFMVGCKKPHRPKFLLRHGELATEHFSETFGFKSAECQSVANVRFHAALGAKLPGPCVGADGNCSCRIQLEAKHGKLILKLGFCTIKYT